MRRPLKVIIAFTLLILVYFTIQLLRHTLFLSGSIVEDVMMHQDLPADLNFGGEPFPHSKDIARHAIGDEIKKLKNNKASTTLLLERANQWLPAIEAILLKENIPQDFEFLPIIESGLTNSESSQDAAGYWQLVSETGRYYGLEINDSIDERYNVLKSTEAACKYLHESYAHFHNWTLVAASYNSGINGIAAAMDRQGKSDFFSLELNDETTNFIYRILAAKTVIRNADLYGFKPIGSTYYPKLIFKKVCVDSSITHLEMFANRYNCSIQDIKLLNPWILGHGLTNTSKKKYSLFVLNSTIKDFEYPLIGL